MHSAKKILRINCSGDTIIEVLLAMTVLTLVLFTSWGLVNRSTQLSLAAQKRIDMVNQLKEQAEILKSKYAAVGGDLSKLNAEISKSAGVSNPEYGQDFCIDDPSVLDSGGRFYADSDAEFKSGTKSVDGDKYSKVWIDRSSDRGGYSDYYIRGCWLTSGGNQKTDNSQFIVRLNS
jgi:hypothetical protein